MRRRRQAVDLLLAAEHVSPLYPCMGSRVERDLDRVSRRVQHLAVPPRPTAGDVDRVVTGNAREASGVKGAPPANVLAGSMLDVVVERDAGD